MHETVVYFTVVPKSLNIQCNGGLINHWECSGSKRTDSKTETSAHVQFCSQYKEGKNWNSPMLVL